MVVASPNVDFGESAHPLADPDQHLRGLKDAFGIYNPSNMGVEPNIEPIREIEIADGNVSEWESDDEILRSRATEDEVAPNGPDPVVPLIPREPNAHVRRRRRSEVEQLADAAGPPPAQEKRRAHATIMEVVDDNCTSVGVVEIKGKDVERGRKHAYHEALVATKNTQLHNEPINVNNVKQKPNWSKWKAAMQEELDSLE